MRPFGQIPSSFWEDATVQQLPAEALILLLYLHTCRHGNGIGCFRLPIEYAVADLGQWLKDRAAGMEAIEVLEKNNLILYEEATKYVMIRRFVAAAHLRSPKNGKHALTCLREIASVKGNAGLVSALSEELRDAAPAGLKSHWGEIDTLSVQHPNHIDTQIQTPTPTPTPTPDTEHGHGGRSRRAGTKKSTRTAASGNGGGGIQGREDSTITPSPAPTETNAVDEISDDDPLFRD